ncbi:MAG: penicillin-binding transpeptidase domain-containing protein [Candidatus Zixiibacteriota bacterium]
MNRTRMERIRLGLMLVAVMLFLGVAIARLAQFQIVDAEQYKSIVEKQSTGRVPIPAERGMIYDRYGRVVAKNVSRQALYAHPQSRKDLSDAAAYLEKIFRLRSGDAVRKYKLEVNKFRWIDRRLDERLAQRIEKEAPPGLYLRADLARQYPYALVGRQILGYTNIDNEGLSGFELLRDSLLSGTSGYADFNRDGRRETYTIREQALVKPIAGQSVVLTVDWQLQEIVEQELAAAVDSFHATLGMAAFLDCRTGEILAMAHFDPAEKDPEHPTKLYPISDQFEPGSAYKPFTAAALLDAGVINFYQTTYCENGLWRVGRRTLADDKKHGWLNFRQIIELSSNIGLGKSAQLVEGPALIDTYRRFGFGSRTGLSFPGETRGSLRPPQVWSDYNVAALAMGHSVATTCLQMANAMAAIANGGQLLEPKLVLGYVDDDGYVSRVGEPKVVNHPLNAVSADTLRAFLRGVVENGTGKPVNSEFVNIAGKTGTAELPNLEQGGYHKNRFMASFCGFFPAEAPIVAGIVALKDPRPMTYGGYTAGKAFRHIAERYTVSHPDQFAATERVCGQRKEPVMLTVEVPDFVGRDIYQARMLAEQRGVNLRSDSLSGVVVWQYPAPDRAILVTDEVVVAVVPAGRTRPTMIDLRGESIRRASAFLDFAGITYTIVGSGRVTEQSVPPGEPITDTLNCRLVCEPS